MTIFSMTSTLEDDSQDEQHFRERSRNSQFYLSITIDISIINSYLDIPSCIDTSIDLSIKAPLFSYLLAEDGKSYPKMFCSV